jgi:hypothetical protein
MYISRVFVPMYDDYFNRTLPPWQLLPRKVSESIVQYDGLTAHVDSVVVTS